MNGDSLYYTDVLTWSEQQATALRRLEQAGVSSILDWKHVIAGIEQVGLAELHEVEGNIRTMLSHAIKGYCDPDSHSRIRWAIETGKSQQDVQKFFTASMRPRIDLDCLWQEAFDLAIPVVRPEIISVPPSIPRGCPFTLDELLAEDFTYDRAVERLYILLTSWRPKAEKDTQS
jgi:hypothetical protein